MHAYMFSAIFQLLEWYESAQDRTDVAPAEYNWARFFWNAGRIAHTVGDSFSCAHTVRDAQAPYKLLFFQVRAVLQGRSLL